MSKFPIVKVGDRVRIDSQGIVVTGIVETVDTEYRYHLGEQPHIIGYNIEVRNDFDKMINYWKSRSDGGTVEIIK